MVGVERDELEGVHALFFRLGAAATAGRARKKEPGQHQAANRCDELPPVNAPVGPHGPGP